MHYLMTSVKYWCGLLIGTKILPYIDPKLSSVSVQVNVKHVLMTSINSRWPSVHKHLVMPLFGNGFSATTSLFIVIDRKE